MKYAGWLLLAIGAIMGYFVISLNYKPDYLNIPVFAVYSSYVNKTILGITQTNLADEIAILCLLFGMAFISFSKQKNEKENYDKLRNTSLVCATFLNTVFLILSTAFVFGMGYITVLILNIFSLLFLYLGVFYVLMSMDKQKADG